MITYELKCEFDVVRRVGWADEDLAEHLDDVIERLRQAAGVLFMDAEADLDTGRVTLAIRFESLTTDDPQNLGSTMLGVAIRSSGGAHQGLLSLAEEAVVKPERSQWSGLRSPTWNVRQMSSSETSTGLR